MSLTTTRNLTKTSILIALGIVIPMVMPKINIPPASYTLASHVPVFISMFISPSVAIAVSLGTAFGFLLSFPLVIAIRALSHLIFAVIGAFYLKKYPETIHSQKKLLGFNLAIGLIHASTECLAVAMFYFLSPNIVDINYFTVVFLMIGVGGFVHSVVDFFIAQFMVIRLQNI